MNTRSWKLIGGAMGCLALGWLLGQSDLVESRAQQAAMMTRAPAFPMAARVAANIYLQSSAEYRALCLQTYACATERLRASVHDAENAPLPPAIVMDLDETVFDNSAFQTYLYGTNQEYEEELWQDYERNHPEDVGLVPGAAAFINAARDMHVTVVFLSNRMERNRESTIKALDHWGLRIEGEDQLLLQTDTSDKTIRRASVTANYNVLMYLGDNLRDFSEEFKAPTVAEDAPLEVRLRAIADRNAKVDENAAHFGHDWFVLPNPVYGEWDKSKLIGTDPTAIMRPTSMLDMPAPAGAK